MEKVANINELQRGDVTILQVKGKLDAILSPCIEKKAVEYINKGSSKLLLDLQDVSYISSAGLRMLLSIKKQMKSVPGKLIVCSLSSEVLEIMKICGFDHVLEISKSQEEALRLF